MNFSELDQLLKYITKERIIPAISIAVAYDGKIVFSKQYGKIYETGCLVNAETKFDIASMTKILSGISFMKMEEEKMISLFEPICRIFPEFNTIKPIEKDGKVIDYCDASKITWYDVLIHTTGMGWTRKKTRPSLPNLDKGLQDIFSLPFACQPGKHIIYSDIPIILMGKAMEKIKNQSLDDIIYNTVTRPLKMYNTMFLKVSDHIENHNIAPTENDTIFRKKRIWGEVHDENSFLMNGVSAHAGIFSTSEDICRLAIAYANCTEHDGLLKKETANKMITEQKEEDGERRGLIWQLKDNNSESYTKYLSSSSYGHAGFTGCFMWNDPLKKMSVVFLSNDVYNGRENRKLFNFRSEIVRLVV